jgi:predicted MFS family arabinose efflux permease
VATGFAVTAAARTLPWLYPLMFLAGLSCAPAVTALTTSFSQAGQGGNQTQNFAWLESSTELGGSAGYAAAGLLLAHSGIIITLLTGAALPIAAAAGVIRQGHTVRHNRRATSRSGS